MKSIFAWTIALAFGAAAVGTGSAQAQDTSYCKFNSGPLAGQTRNYAPNSEAVGLPCMDYATGSTGIAVAPPNDSGSGGSGSGGSGSGGSGSGGSGSGGSGSEGSGSHSGSGMTTVCHFTSGPRAGQDQDYAPRPPIPVGSSCWDGISSYGVGK